MTWNGGIHREKERERERGGEEEEEEEEGNHVTPSLRDLHVTRYHLAIDRLNGAGLDLDYTGC
jgi:hypothetical protein